MPLTTLGAKLLTKTLLSNPVPSEVLDRLTVPGLFVVSLFTTNPDVSGNGGIEPGSEDGYTRSVAAFSAVEEATTALGGFLKGAELVNSTPITFPTATGSWGTIVGIGIYYPTNADVFPQYTARPIYYESLALIKNVGVGEQVVINPGEVKIFLGADR